MHQLLLESIVVIMVFLKYLILMVEICMETVTLKGHAFF